MTCTPPHLIDTEVLHALRRLLRKRQISPERAHDAGADYAELTLVRYPHEPLDERVWELRESLTAYDATLAHSPKPSTSLVTCDARLAAAPRLGRAHRGARQPQRNAPRCGRAGRSGRAGMDDVSCGQIARHRLRRLKIELMSPVSVHAS